MPFQEKLAAMNPQWIDSIEAAERGEDVLAGTPGLQRPDGDVEIGEEFLRKGLFKVGQESSVVLESAQVRGLRDVPKLLLL